MSDRIALDVMQCVRDWSDIEVVSIVGFDDIPAAAAAGLTTIRQDVFEKGRLAARVLLEDAPAVRLPVELVVRDT
jgi:DNA-binding LacI/PurR family transcriptional regulator